MEITPDEHLKEVEENNKNYSKIIPFDKRLLDIEQIETTSKLKDTFFVVGRWNTENSESQQELK